MAAAAVVHPFHCCSISLSPLTSSLPTRSLALPQHSCWARAQDLRAAVSLTGRSQPPHPRTAARRHSRRSSSSSPGGAAGHEALPRQLHSQVFASAGKGEKGKRGGGGGAGPSGAGAGAAGRGGGGVSGGGNKSAREEEAQGARQRAAFEATMDKLRELKGYEAVQYMQSDEKRHNVPVIPSGSLALDAALGTGGYPRGRVVEIYGPEATGKTTLALHAIAEAQKLGGHCAFIDVENALDASMARALGVDPTRLVLPQADSGQDALHAVDHFVRGGCVDVVVLDSAMRKLTASMANSPRTLVILINQHLRTKISPYGTYGGPTEVTAGGKAIQYYASVRLDIRRIAPVKRGNTVVGNIVRVKVVKNKLAPPHREAEFEIAFGQGISREGELADLAVEHDVFSKSGAWYSYRGDSFSHGRDKAKAYLTANPQVFEEVEQEEMSD
eukprot:jgi/Mesen1/5257/ME000263S04368